MNWFTSAAIQSRKQLIKSLKLVTYNGELQDSDGNQITPVGVQGNAAGFRYNIDLSATTAGDPGQGKLRFNHATLASVTEIYIDNLDVTGADVSTMLDAMGNSQMVIKANDNLDGSFAVFTVSAVADSTGYRKLTVTHQAGSTFSANEAAVVQFAPRGAAGANGTNGTNGTNGANAYLYIGYASDSNGTDFTTTFNANLGFVAFKNTTSPIASPAASDFTGLWRLIKGADGVNGTNGSNGTNGVDGVPGIGRFYTYKASTSAGSPGFGAFRLNNTATNLVTHIYISKTAMNSIDASGELGLWQVNGRIHLRSAAVTDGSYAVYEIDLVTASTDYIDFTVTHLASNSTLNFTAEEKTVVSYIGMDLAGASITEAAVLAAGNFARYEMSGSDVVGMLDPAGNLMYGINPSKTWTELLALTDMPVGTVMVLDKSSLGGTHITPGIIRVEWNGTNWLPCGGSQLMFRGAGSVASPLATGASATTLKFPIAASPSFPANFFTLGSGLRIVAKYAKTDGDTTQSTFAVKFGQSDSVAGTDTAFIESTSATHTNKTVKIEGKFTFSALGAAGVAVITTDNIAANGGGETTQILDRNTQINTGLTQYVVFTLVCPATAGATHSLVYYDIFWEA